MSEDAQNAWHMFEAVGVLCSFFFGIPLALVLLRILSGLFSSPLTAASYIELELYTDLAYAVILAGLTFIPTLGTYFQFRRQA
ncbi:MAG: hypothetical protein HY913_01705 [Desulfomonile tiedjei]|nr:hypothetical protein [Desulfomonile tiedjei]